MDPVVSNVGIEGLVDVAGTQLSQGVAFPRVHLTAVLVEETRAESCAKAADGAAGVDLGKLARVTDQHDLGVGVFSVVEESGHLAGPDHGGLVNHHHRPGSEVGWVELGCAPVDRAGGNAGVVLEVLGRAGGERAADHPIPGRFPGLACRGEGERLARPGDTFDDFDPVTRRTDRAHHVVLLGRQRPTRQDGGVDRSSPGDCAAGGLPEDPGIDHGEFDLEHLWGCPPLLRGLGGDDLAVVAADGGGVTVAPDGQHVLGADEPVDQVQDVLYPAAVG